MSSTTIGLLAFGIAVIITTILFLHRRGARNSKSREAMAAKGTLAASLVVAVDRQPAAIPEAIHFGTDPAKPAVTLRPLALSDLPAVVEASAVEPSAGVASRISALMQAAPSALVAEAHSGRQLMEVVIDGKLVRAADGDGFRAMAMGTNGIKEHARLFETKDLTNLVNAAAVWQLASVIVAQKHMADISQKLGEIKAAVEGISEFLDDARRSTIRGTYQYLQQGYDALAQGELSSAIRGELESCERELLAVQNHLVADIRRRTQLEATDDDTFGTESLHTNSVAKYHRLTQTVEDLKACLRTRVLCWYVLSLYPGEQALKAARFQCIKQGLDDLVGLQALVASYENLDVGRFKSWLNRDTTLDRRRSDVLVASGEVQRRLEATRTGTFAQLETSQTLLIERDAPTQLFVELMNGRVLQIRQRELIGT